MEAKDNYKIDEKLLRAAKFRLSSMPHNPDTTKEILLLDTLLYNEDDINILNDSFIENFRRDKKSIIFDYYDYLAYIYAFLDDNESLNPTFTTFNKKVIDPEEIFARIHDFYFTLDPQWFLIFNTLYRRRKETFTFDTNRPFSMYLSQSNLWLSGVPLTNTINDTINLVHEYGHGIQDIIAGSRIPLSPNKIFVELLPITLELIYIDTASDVNVVEKSKYLLNLLSDYITYSREIITKNSVYNSICDVKNPRNLARILKRKTNASFTKQEIIDMWTCRADEQIAYVFNFIIAQELLKVYKKDKLEFFYILNSIMRSDEKPLELIKKYNIEPM